MNTVDLSQFASLFEIGFALHFAVAFIERIYARELPVRIERINKRAKALERFKQEVSNAQAGVRMGNRVFQNPVWVAHNNQVLDRLYALRVDTNRQMSVLSRILNIITFLSVIVVLYSVAVLFAIGLNVEQVQGLSRVDASLVVLLQLLPLPLAACVFFFIARKMSHAIDRKIRGVSELNVMLSPPNNNQMNSFVSVEQVYRSDASKNHDTYQSV